MTDVVSADARVGAVVRERWESGAVVDVTLRPDVPVDGWRLTIDAGGDIVNLWNAEAADRQGTVYVLRAADFNAQVPAGDVVEFGFEVAGTGPVELLGIEVDRTAPIVPASPEPAEPDPQTPAPELGDPSLDAADRLSSDAEILRAVEAEILPLAPGLAVDVDAVTETRGAPPDLFDRTFAPGPLSTSGERIVDAAGEPVAIHGLNWFGLETEIAVPHGLWERNWRVVMDEVKSLGFNALRIPFSGDLVATGGGEPSGIDPALNPDLAGLDGLEVLDAVVAYADTIGLAVLLDYHRGPPGGGPNESGLWFGSGRTETDVIAEWRAMAERYGDAPAVIGADLVNEPFAGTWGDGSATDWARAAERIGNAVQDVAPDWLIVVEGIAQYEGEAYWWGGNLQGVADRPLRLERPDKLVYSAHDYPPSVHPQPWFFDGTDLTEAFYENWGYIVEEGIAPVLIGEWGSRLESAADRRWAEALAEYLDLLDAPWMWWSLNPNSADTGGLFAGDWRTVRPEVIELLDRFLTETRPDTTLADIARTAEVATFRVTLDRAAESETVVKFATTDGTARAGEDYLATAGTLRFDPGEQMKTVNVPILADGASEGNAFFYLVLGAGGTPQGSAVAVIEGEGSRRGPGGQPVVDVANAVVSEQTGAARFRLVLSEPAARDVSIAFTTRATTVDGRETRSTEGTVVIPAGERGAVVEVEAGDDAPDARRFTLELTAAAGADIGDGVASGVGAATAPRRAEIAVAASPAEEVQLMIDLILKEDWGSGALFNVSISNVSDTAVTAWQMALDLPFDVAELWDARLVADEGERVVLRNGDGNGTIGPGGSVDFGFISDAGDVALARILAAADIELTVQ
jgi:aryl-phospho-beta-D-glucosidase BglC (GH1 family)